MSAVGQPITQLEVDIQNELLTANQLLRNISIELHQIKHLTNPGSDFEANITQNAALISKLANMQQIDILNLPPMTRKQTDINKDVSNEK